jgi:uncharacterized protein (TIGR02270 family)
MRVINEIVEQHTEDAAFLWLLRSEAVSAPHYDLNDLSDLDNRVESHIDGLRVAGNAGREICQEALSWEKPEEIFAAGVLAFERGAAPFTGAHTGRRCGRRGIARGGTFPLS